MGWGSMFSAFGIAMDDSSDTKAASSLLHAKGSLLLNSEHWLYSAWWHLIVFLTYWYEHGSSLKLCMILRIDNRSSRHAINRTD